MIPQRFTSVLVLLVLLNTPNTHLVLILDHGTLIQRPLTHIQLALLIVSDSKSMCYRKLADIFPYGRAKTPLLSVPRHGILFFYYKLEKLSGTFLHGSLQCLTKGTVHAVPVALSKAACRAAPDLI